MARSIPSTRTRPLDGNVKRRDQADDRGFARARRADQRRDGPRLRFETHLMKNFLAGIVGKVHIFHDDSAVDAFHSDRAARIFVFFLFVQDFAGALEAGDGFGDLRADGDDLKHRSNQETEEKIERKPVAQGHAAAQNFVAAQLQHESADDSEKGRAGKAHQGGGRERFQNVVEQTLDACAENPLFAFLGVIALHDAHAAERFGEPAGHFGGDFGPRAEDGANR